MNVYLLSFNKRYNSTEQPTLTGVTPFSCKLKQPCSVLQPVLQMAFNDTWKNSVYLLNYAYIPDFHRYYRVVNWQFNGVLTECTLKVDVLASFKSSITASSQYVLRSYSSYDGNIPDTKYPVKANAPTVVAGTYQVNPLQPPVSGGVRLNGVFIVGIISDMPSVTGCVTYYALSDDMLAELIANLFTLTTQWGNGGQDLADGLKKAITDPMAYVVSCMWLPYTLADFTSRNLVTYQGSIKVGYDTVSMSNYGAYVINGTVTDGLNIQFTNCITISKPDHPLASTRGIYMNREPFTRYYLSFYPFCNLIELDGMRFGGSIYLVYSVDLRTGKGVLNICSGYAEPTTGDYYPSITVRSIEAQVGVNVPLAAIRTELPTSISSFAQNFATAAISSEAGGFKQAINKTKGSLANWVMGGIANLLGSEDLKEAVSDAETTMDTWTSTDMSNIASSAMTMKSSPEAIGGQGTMSLYSRMPLAMWAECFTPVDDEPALFGRPLCDTVTLSTLSGFCMCDNPRIIASGAYAAEIGEIETFMSTGFFLY